MFLIFSLANTSMKLGITACHLPCMECCDTLPLNENEENPSLSLLLWVSVSGNRNAQ